MTPKQLRIIGAALSYLHSNLDDANEAFDEVVATERELTRLRALIAVEGNEARKLSTAYFSLYPKESPAITLANNPGMDTESVWESSDCTFNNWLIRLRENPRKALSRTNWAGKVTKAYFKMLGHLVPTSKAKMMEAVEEILKQEREADDSA